MPVSDIRELIVRCARVLIAGLVFVLPAHAGKLLHIWDCPADVPLLDQVISPDERMVAQLLLLSPNAGTDAAVQVVDFRKLCHPVQPKDEAPVASPVPTLNHDMQFTADGAFLLFSAGASLRVLDGRNLKPVSRFTVPVRAPHVAFVRGVKVASAAHIAAALVRPEKAAGQSEPNLTIRPEFISLVRVYDLDTGEVLSDYSIGRQFVDISFAISPDGSKLAIAVGSSDPRNEKKLPDILIVDTHSGKLAGEFTTGARGKVYFADEHTIYVAGTPRTSNSPICGWSQQLLAFDIRQGKIVLQEPFCGHGLIRDVVASNHGTYIATSMMVCTSKTNCRDRIAIWDSAFHFLAGFESGAMQFPSLKFSSTGRLLVRGSSIFEFDLR